MDIIFVTNKKSENWERNLETLEKTITSTDNIIVTGLDASPNVNRNHGLDKARTKEVILIDDNISGFHHCWADRIGQILWYNPKIVCVSARLSYSDGGRYSIHGDNGDYVSRHSKCNPGVYQGYTRLPIIYLPMSCLIMRKNDARFNENIGEISGEIAYMTELNELYPDSEFHICNQVELTYSK